MQKEFFSDSGLARLGEEFIRKTLNGVEDPDQKLDFFKQHIKGLVDLLPHDPAAYKMFALGFLTTAGLYPTRVSKIYSLLSVLCFLEVRQRGVQILPDELADFVEKRGFPKSEELRKGFEIQKTLSLDEAQEMCRGQKNQGKKVGLVHGHFRILTPNHFVFLILAAKECDSLFMGVEKGERTRDFKGKRILFTDDEREKIFGLALREMPITSFWIDRETAYSNEGYTDLVRRFEPSVYIGQAMDSEDRKKAMRQRVATLPSSKFAELPLVESLHTSHLEELIFPKDNPLSVLGTGFEPM